MAMDIEVKFRGMFTIADKDILSSIDIVAMIEAAINVAGFTVPDKLEESRSAITKALFSDDKTDFGNNDGGGDTKVCVAPSKIYPKRFKKAVQVPKNVCVQMPTAVCTSPEAKNDQEGIKKAVGVSQVVIANPPRRSTSKNCRDYHDNSMKSKLEATSRKLAERYREESEKKAKRKIECIDYISQSDKVKAPSNGVRERLLAKMKRRRH